MKYQIQTYRPDSPTAKREVMAETEGVLTQDDINQWYFDTIGDAKPPEGEEFTLVPDNHPWFQTKDPQGTHGPNENIKQQSKALPIENEEVATDVLLVRENQRRLNERAANIEHEAKVAKMLKELQAAR